MKKLVLLIAVIGLFTVSSNAQETFKKGTKLLEASIGFSSNGSPLVVSYEAGVKDNLFNVNKLNLGIGGYLGYYGYSTTVAKFGGTSKSNFSVIAPGIRALVHYQLIDKLDAYAGPAIGFSVQFASTEAANMETQTANTIKFSWGFAGGLRYEITPNWGAFIEAGKASGNFTLGAAYKF
jgi:opacity protein-like surface antigen